MKYLFEIIAKNLKKNLEKGTTLEIQRDEIKIQYPSKSRIDTDSYPSVFRRMSFSVFFI